MFGMAPHHITARESGTFAGRTKVAELSAEIAVLHVLHACMFCMHVELVCYECVMPVKMDHRFLHEGLEYSLFVTVPYLLIVGQVVSLVFLIAR